MTDFFDEKDVGLPSSKDEKAEKEGVEFQTSEVTSPKVSGEKPRTDDSMQEAHETVVATENVREEPVTSGPVKEVVTIERIPDDLPIINDFSALLEEEELERNEKSSLNKESTSKTSEKKTVQDLLLQNSQKNSKRNVRHSTKKRKQNSLNWSKLVEQSRSSEAREYHKFPVYFYTGFWVRAFAFLVDLLCISAITSIILNTGLGWLNLTQNGSHLSIYSLLSLIIYLGYFILLTKLTNGQTIGKMIFGIQVVCFKEEKLSWSTVLIREGACRFGLQWGILFLGYLAAGFTPKKQHLGDFFSDTSVVTVNYIKAYSGFEY